MVKTAGRPLSPDIYFELEMKLKFALLNYEHRVDYLRAELVKCVRTDQSSLVKQVTSHMDAERK